MNTVVFQEGAIEVVPWLDDSLFIVGKATLR